MSLCSKATRLPHGLASSCPPRARHFSGAAPLLVKQRQTSLSVKHPEFSYRSARGMVVGGPLGKENVEYTKNADEADEILAGLRASRLAIHHQLRTVETPSRTGGSVYKAVGSGVMGIADGDGVIVLHLSHMKRLPRRLLQIFEDPRISKEAFGALTHLADFDKLSDMWENVQCENMVELRLLAPELVPRLKQPDAQARDTSHATFKRFACQDLLKVDMREPLDDQEYHVNRLVGAPFDYIVNSTWLLVQLRAKLDELMDQREVELSAKFGERAAAMEMDRLIAECTFSTRELRSHSAQQAWN